MASCVAPFESQDNQLYGDVSTIVEEPTEAKAEDSDGTCKW